MQAYSEHDPTRKDAHCRQHGAYVAKRLPFVNRWTACPGCVEAEREAVAAAAAEAAAAEERKRQASAMAAFAERAAVPARFVGKTLDNFVATTPDQLAALELVRGYVSDFEDNLKRGVSLILAGRPGTGKSHMAVAVMQAIAPRPAVYMTAMDLIRRVRETWRRDSEISEGKLLDQFARLDLLVLDELGVQYGTDGERNVLFDVLDRRYRDMRPVVLLTNENRRGLRDAIGERSYDRLRETAVWVPFQWDSHRGVSDA